MRTDEKILLAAADLVSRGGIADASFDAIALKLGISKQAVLYWFRTKQELVAALYATSLRAESDAAIRALDAANDHKSAITCFVEGVVAFHLSDLNRFRMMYLLPQTLGKSGSDKLNEQTLERIHTETNRLYEALAGKLALDPVKARQHALVVHSAVLGLVLMLGLAEGVSDPLKHSQEDLIAGLIERLSPES